MTNKTTAQKIAVMQAFLDGKTIEFCNRNRDWRTWCYTREPHWNWEVNDYRIKEEVLPYRRYVAKCYASGVSFVHTINTNNVPAEVEKTRTFVRWIDTDWQTV